MHPAPLKFAAQSQDNQAIWAAVLEKAYAKMKGSYADTHAGYIRNGLRVVEGLPAFFYSTLAINSQ